MFIVNLVKKLFTDKRIRFVFVGGLNTCLGYGSYVLLVYLGLNPYAATTLSTIIGITNSYFWNKYFTFRSSKKSVSEIIRFITVYGFSYTVNLALVYLFVERLGMNEYVTGFFCLLITTFVSYAGHNFFSFINKEDDP